MIGHRMWIRKQTVDQEAGAVLHCPRADLVRKGLSENAGVRLALVVSIVGYRLKHI
jgi:hypothetical protein